MIKVKRENNKYTASLKTKIDLYTKNRIEMPSTSRAGIKPQACLLCSDQQCAFPLWEKELKMLPAGWETDSPHEAGGSDEGFPTLKRMTKSATTHCLDYCRSKEAEGQKYSLKTKCQTRLLCDYILCLIIRVTEVFGSVSIVSFLFLLMIPYFPVC